MSVIQLLHGTDHIIEVPDIRIGNPHNDYGMGFYCTKVDEMAREWACKKNTDGFVNSYAFDTDGLKVLNLLDTIDLRRFSLLNRIICLMASVVFVRLRAPASERVISLTL